MTPAKVSARCGHYDMCIAVCDYGKCENEDPDYNDPKHCKYDTGFHPSTRQILTRIRAAIHEEEYEVECLDDPVVDMFVVDRVIDGEVGKLQAK